MIGVKICGISDARGFEAAVTHGADWVGFVFFPGSPRALDGSQAASLLARHPGTAAVGLFVRAADDEIARCLDRLTLHALQLYDTPERAASIAERFRVPVWLACPVSHEQQLPQSPSHVSRLVVEASAPAGASRPGGNGVALDWSSLRGWPSLHAGIGELPWMLAGGLDPDNVSEAIRASGAQAVDVSSGVETAPGRKDPTRIAAFIRAAKATSSAGP